MSAPLSDQLLELHVKHELQRLTSEQIEKDIKAEVDAFLELSSDIKLKELISSDQLIKNLNGAIRLEPNIDKSIKKIVIAIYNDKRHEKTSLSNLIGDDELELLIDKALDLNIARNELIENALHNKLVKDVIADLLYSGISRYMAQGNAMAKKVPGAKTMMNIGKGFVNRAAPELEEKLEKQIKRYIGIALPELLAQSEKFIANSVSDEDIKEIVNEVWQALKEKPIAGFKEFISEGDVEEITELVLQQVHIDPNADGDDNKDTNARYVMGLAETGIKAFYKEYGNKKLSILMKDLGLNADYINEQLAGVLPSIVETLKQSGLLEARLRERLENFYQSPAVQEVLSTNS
jgi:hypothetical protein